MGSGACRWITSRRSETLVFQWISAGACRSMWFRPCRCSANSAGSATSCRSLLETGLAFTRLDLTASAFYGEGGVRLLAAPRSAVSPYVEGTAGVAHLRLGARGLGSTTDAIIRAALNLVDTRDPLFGAGGGVLMRAGPLHVDLGYRFKRIVANSTLSSMLSVGQDLQSHQVRFGVGVRF